MKVSINEAEMRAFLEGPESPIVRTVADVTRKTQNGAKRRAPVDTGHLRASVQQELDARPGRITGTVYSRLEYAIYQEQGTGIYAGNGPIKPTSGKFLVFTPKGSRNVVFARQVRGTPPTHFLLNALKDASPWPVTTL